MANNPVNQKVEALRLAKFLKARRTHLGPCRERCDQYYLDAWDDYAKAWTMLEAMAARVNCMDELTKAGTQNPRTADKLMEQAQVFASAWSLVDGPFDAGGQMDAALAEKEAMRQMLIATEKANEAIIQSLTHQLKLVSEALEGCIIASGIVRSDIDGLSGPQLLFFADDLKAMLTAPAKLSTAPLPTIPTAITSSLMFHDSGEQPVYCVMVAYRTEEDARTALAALSTRPNAV